MKDYQIAVESCEILQSASGHIRSELGKKIRLRYVPLLFFIPSNAVEYGASILEKINKLNINNTGENNSNYETEVIFLWKEVYL